MRRLIITVGSFVLLSVLPSSLAQPPMTPAPTAPAAAEAPLTQFEPLAAFPQATQSAVRSAVHGANWLARMNQSQGRFLYGYRPALRQPMDGDQDLKQARAALAMAQAARFTGNERHAVVAGQAILAMLSLTKIDPADPNCRMPVASSASCNRVGLAATLALAIYELPGADEKLLAEAERMCEFLHRQLRTDGSVHYIDALGESPLKVDPAGVNEYPGVALNAISMSNRAKPAAWKTDALKRGIEHYRALFKTNPHPMLAATLTPAFTDCFLQTKWNDAAASVLEMNDWLIGLQYAAGDPRHPGWAGGFRSFANGQAVETEPGFESGCYLHSLACGYHLLRFNPDLTRAARYKQATVDALTFLTAMQYTETNTRHFENGFRANTLLGGFYLTPTDGNLRIDAQAAGLAGLLHFLNCGAEKN